MKVGFEKVSALIDADRSEMVSTLARMISIKSISPASGGSGEAKRADFLQSLLRRWGFKVKRYDYLDGTRTKRSNLVVKFGAERRTLWVIAHTDTVAEGDRRLWKTDPFKAKIENGRIYGRGSADDGCEVVASIFALKALKDSGAKLRYSMGVALAADEELGSKYGIKKLMREGIFKKQDLVLVPDYSSPGGRKIEISEKSMLWLKITVVGRQVHASAPQLGVNASRYAARLINEIDRYMHKKYNGRERLFNSPSTFEPTKHEKNVDSTNIIPGTDVFYMDCRVLPRYNLDSVISDFRRIARRKEFGRVKIKIETFQRDAAAPTSEKAEIVVLLKRALKELRGIDARCVGSGGGTVAYFFRRRGIPAAAWGTMPGVAHQPNEYAVIDRMLNDAKVFAYLCL